MNTNVLVAFLKIAAGLHLVLIWAGTTMPRVVKLREHLAVLPAFIRRLFFVYYVFIGLMLVGFGILTFLFAREMAMGEPIARALCIFLTVFWMIRLLAAIFVFDVRPYLISGFYRIGYHVINVVFLYLLLIYALTAWKGGRL
jgi:hypothetical protein